MVSLWATIPHRNARVDSFHPDAASWAGRAGVPPWPAHSTEGDLMSDIAHAWSDDEGARRALALLADHFPDPAPGAGGVPAGAWAAPGRVNLIGEHLDYNGGDVLPMALPHSTFAAVRPRGDRWVRLVTADPQPAIWEGALEDVRPEADVPTWVRYAVGSAWILGREHPLTGVDAALVSCLPVGAGLSSSAAVECVLALALGDLFGLHRTPAELAAACVRAENEVVGAPTGGMDQAASMLCSRGHALHLHCADGTIEQVPFDLAAEGLELLVIDTRAAHSLVDGQYAQRRATCEAVARREGLEHLALAPDPAGVLARCAMGPSAAGCAMCSPSRDVSTDSLPCCATAQCPGWES